MSRLITALLLTCAILPAAKEVTAPTYQTDLHIVYSNDIWTQLEDDDHVAMVNTKKLEGSTEAGTVYRITWTTHNTETETDDTVIKVEVL